MKSLFLSILIVFITYFTHAQTVQWVKIGLSEGFENGNGIVVDDSSNVYVTGQVEFSSVFDHITIHTLGSHDILVAKYNKDGLLKWARGIGGRGGDVGNGMSIDASQNTYVTGEMEDTVNFGNGNTLISSGSNDIFFAKFSSNGQTLWATRWGNTSGDKGLAVVTTPSGDSYVTGYFGGSVTFGNTTLNASGGRDMFIVKVNSSGNVQWAIKGGGSGDDKGNGLALDKNGNLYVAGSFATSANFSGINVSNPGPKNAFLAKYDTTGSIQWVRIAGGCCDETSFSALSLDVNNEVYVGGYFYASTSIGSYNFTSAGSSDVLTAKYSATGNLVWANKGGGIDEDRADGIKVDTTNHYVYITGNVSAAGNFDSYNYPFYGYRDIFVVAYDTSGLLKWGKIDGGTRRDLGSAITCDKLGYIYVTGLFNGTANFDSYVVNGYPNQPWADFFVDKISTLPASLPSTGVSNLNATNGNCTNLLLTFNPGNGSGRIVIARKNSPVNKTPSNGTMYTGNANFGSGTDLGNGNYIVYNGTGNMVTITGLSPASTYYFSVIEYSGTGGTLNYAGTPVTTSATTSNYTINVSGLQSGVCSGDSMLLQASGASTYTWSPASGLSSTTGAQVYAFPSTTTTYTINAVNGSGCPATKNVTVNIYPPPTINFSNPSDICTNSSPVQLTSASPSGGSYSGPGVSNGQFNPSGLSSGSHTLYYSYTNAQGCSNTVSATIFIKPLPTVTLPAIPPSCNADGPLALNGSPSGGTYSGTGVSSGSFYPSTGVGSYVIQYMYTAVSGCTNSATQTAIVNASPSVTMSPVAAVCENDAPVALNGSPAGGIFSGTGVSSGNFIPSTGAGTYPLTYTYTTTAGCPGSATQSVQVKPIPVVALSSISPSCANAGPITLNGSPSGGVFSGSGVVSNKFYPSTGAGSYTIDYTYTATNGCSNKATRTAVVNPVPYLNLGRDTTICGFSSILLDAGAGFVSYVWSNGSSSQVLSVDSAGTGIGNKLVFAQVSDALGCTTRDTILITFDICSGIFEKDLTGINVYPNPFHNAIFLTSKNKFNYAIYDLCGKLLKKEESVYDKVETGEELLPGIYLMEINQNNSRQVFTIIKLK